MYLFCTHMQATAPIPSRDLARELKSAHEARQIASPVTVEPVVDWNLNNRVDGGSTPTYDEFLFCLFFKIRVYKRNNDHLVVDPIFISSRPSTRLKP